MAVPDFSILSHKRHGFREKISDNETRVSIFSTTFLFNFFFKETFGKTVSYMYWGRRVNTRYSLQILMKIKF
jgi:hypothetical protein